MGIAKHVGMLIGKTPLVDLSALLGQGVRESGTRLLAKYEAANPGGSVKDRVAKAMLDDAEAQGTLVRGGTIIEPTSGNTGVGLAMLAAERGYKMILTMPETMSVERRKLAASYGAQIVLTPAAKGMQGAIDKAEELHKTVPNSFIAGQFSNPANPKAHYETTGPEIWTDTEGKIDIFIACVGTGGTISGTAQYLKEQNPAVRAIAVEPSESPVLSGGSAASHIIQGIGAGFIPENYHAQVIDEVLCVTGDDAIAMRGRLATELGLLVGISSGAAVAAAINVASDLKNMGATIVTVLPDTGERYLSLDI